MSRDYNIRKRHLVRFMNRLFDGDVLLVYQNVRDKGPSEGLISEDFSDSESEKSSEIWRLMSVVCNNSNHQASVRDEVFRLKYDSRN